MTLRPEQRAAIVLRYYEDLSEVDTAEALGIPIGTVKSTVSRGMDRLREELNRDA
jgi:RNA polymerase sigma factor (sigma-70 family)